MPESVVKPYSNAARVLLVELVTTDRFHSAPHFPHLKALLRHQGVAVEWVRFAMPAAVQMTRDEEGVGLDERDTAALVGAIGEMGADHVLFSHHPSATLVARIRATAGGAAMALAVFGSVASLSTVRGGEALASFERVADVEAWAGVAAPLGPSFWAPPSDLALVPDFAYRPLNGAAREMQPYAFIQAGNECSHLRDLCRAPFFADLVDAGDVAQRHGCTFCRRPLPEPTPKGAVPPLDWAQRQLQALRETHPASPTGELSLRIVGERVTARIDELADAMAGMGLPRSEILVDTRADTLVKLRDRLARAARTLGAAGHRLEVCLVGVESFSDRELERFNKGYGPATNLAAVRVLRELERELPEAFGFRKYGGLSTILFTPWTRIEDVALNLAVVRRFSLERICGKLLTSRVRLYEDLPLAAAARRDGLLTEAYDDPVLDTARRNFYASELPWRFADARVERLNRLSTRLQDDPALEGDPLYERVQAWRAAQVESEIVLAERLCETIAAYPDETDLDRIMALASATEQRRAVSEEGEPVGVVGAARARTDALRPDLPDSRKPTTPPPTSKDPLLSHSVDWWGFVAGFKPVTRLEPLTPSELDRVRAVVAEEQPGSYARERRRDWEGVESYELFVGRDPARVDEAVEIQETRTYGVKGQEGPELVLRTGELLGYPPCCTERFANTAEAGWLHNEWLHLRNRVETPGPVPVELRPFDGLVSYVLCSADCPRALEHVEALGRLGFDPAPPWAYWPILFLLDRPSHYASLEPLSPVGERFLYRVAAVFGHDERLDRLAEGSVVEVAPGQIRVFRDEGDAEALVTFSLDAYLWWHEAAFHPKLWQLAVQQKLDPIPEPDEPTTRSSRVSREVAAHQARQAAEEEEEAARVPRLDAVLGWLRRFLNELGFGCRSVLPTLDGALDFVLERGGRRVAFRWLNRDAGGEANQILGAPVVPLGDTPPEALASLLPPLGRALLPAWDRVLRDRLDRGNREHQELDPSQGIRFLTRRRLAEGRPLWAEYVLTAFEELEGNDGHPAARLTADGPGGRVVFGLGAVPDAADTSPLLTTALGALTVLEDGRATELRGKPAHAVERAVGFHLSRAVPADARWGVAKDSEQV